MRIDLTVSAAGRSHDLAILAAEAVPLARVASDLAGAVGAAADAGLWSGERALTPQTRLGDAGLRTGAVLTVGAPERESSRPGVLSLHVVGGLEAGHIVPVQRGRLTIGRAPECGLVVSDDRASRVHAALDITANSLVLHDLSSTNGTSLDGGKVATGGSPVRTGQLIRIGDTLLTVCGPDDAPASISSAPGGTVMVNRAPRSSAPVTDREIAVPQRPDSSRPRGVQWISALIPAVAGCGLAWFTDSPQFLLFALLSPVMMISTSLGDRVHWRRSRRQAAATYTQRRAAADLEIAEGLAAETGARRVNAPDPASVWRLTTAPSSRLWERRRSDADRLHVRLGSADLPAALKIRIGATVSSAGILSGVPLCADLGAGPLGIAGPPDVTTGLAHWLLAQVAATHSPNDVEVGLLLSADTAPQWSWARWLPHLRGRIAVGPAEWPELVADLGRRLEQRRASHRFDPHEWTGEWLVLMIDRAAALTDVPGLATLLADGPALGLTAICVDVDAHALPTSCASVARVRGDIGTRVELRRGISTAGTEAVIDRVSPEWAARVARALAPLVDAGGDDSTFLPERCRWLAAAGCTDLGPATLISRWAASSGRADTVLGVSADGLLRIDLSADGPHALIAGTTGAGKSELLQSLVAGLAADHPPDELTFLLVDYKGGAAFAECARLPHTAGLVTDLDPHLTRRALHSLNAELRRRERLLGAAGAVDLDSYRPGAADEPLARLIIVVDEFAALNEELPEFIRGLVGVAQRGRSLGLHLVLATQRPGSAVSAEIRANTSLRIALRVTDPGDSDDVIDAPDAATIERSVPGRGYLRTGSRLTCFQTGRIGGAAEIGLTAPLVTLLGAWRRAPVVAAAVSEQTDLGLLVERLGDAARLSGRAPAPSPWLAPLPRSIPAAGIDIATPGLVPIGRIDLPAIQAQEPLTVDLGQASTLLIAGAPRSGRTTALTTIAIGAAARSAPRDLEIYVIDPTGSLTAGIAGLPHIATSLGPEDSTVAATLLRRLEQSAGRRQSARPGGGAVSEGRALLLIDGWDGLLAALGDAEAARCGELLTALLRAGPHAGLTTVVAGDRTLLTPRFAGAFSERLLLRFADRGDYGLAGIPDRAVPTALPPGRGVRASDRVEFQVAHAGTSPTVGAVRLAAGEVGRRWHSAASNEHAIRIRPLPTATSLDQLPHDDRRITVGLVGDTAEPWLVDPFAGAARLLVAGPPRSGRTTFLCSMLVGAIRIGVPTIVAAGRRSALVDLARQHNVPVIDPTGSAEDVGAVPAAPTLVLIDDSELFVDGGTGERLASWVRAHGNRLAVVVAGRCDDLATTYRGVAADVRRSHCAVLLRPGPIDGELVGVRLPRRADLGPPGRGVIVGDPAWGPLFADGTPVPVQVATP